MDEDNQSINDFTFVVVMVDDVHIIHLSTKDD
jgi:hypothetical protein